MCIFGAISPKIVMLTLYYRGKNDESIKPHAHSDYVYNFINTYNHNLDIMIEAKHKELAVKKYLDIHA